MVYLRVYLMNKINFMEKSIEIRTKIILINIIKNNNI